MEKWQEELTASIRSIEDLRKFFPVSESSPLFEVVARARMSITPHTAKLIDWNNPNDPLFLMSVPNEQELMIADDELDDPIGDKMCSPIPFVARKYEDRVLIQVSFVCPQYCRYCFRRDRTGCATPGPTAEDRERIREYLITHSEIKEVILSGGEPLLLSDTQLYEWFELIRSVGKNIRVHTRVPANLPSRFTSELIELLSRFEVRVITHFNHPRELAPENFEVLKKLLSVDLRVENQSVLLRGVNDSTEILRELIEKLGEIGIEQHAIHQLDVAKGIGHFRVSIEKGREIVRGLGLAVPYYLDNPDGSGKRNLLKE
ncbi:MAG: Translation elongation factor P-lysyl-lysine 2,3-aminomutase [Candidatus Uhrbacteria bacterium GW2011_GWE2_45_35]|uniref:Translation elongation factor P-lysyl-lysine 2,3-aminomutase n=2 Tax=Candidatus Uhriibacteriota TaxID=1752732 RepID=A0A0G1JFR7_9BACT|nr:MAG: Translation elongation factor P-lysyl-lysine 2,3-aminomutase [Candidatus Uhrbacteria bacterium GW2011_GWF2_44_350]KKU07030.1 MAG: Translation elongation factor P-lysyl-lysine 2,3-aminomutase [Candidatus Uhrbacteria bacterium GW2011_GWE2_45_35]HBR80173.1 lysine 2,3-aminomutase [Candidatus Uhrbacteria bacterium]HCU31971.1 lysine 2,3-aminomutase [Candidatus Uhrbacteria bacterium]